MIISSKMMISFQNMFMTSHRQGMLKMRPGNSSEGKLELIGLSSLFEINIIVFHLLTHKKSQLVVENNCKYIKNYSFQSWYKTVQSANS